MNGKNVEEVGPHTFLHCHRYCLNLSKAGNMWVPRVACKYSFDIKKHVFLLLHSSMTSSQVAITPQIHRKETLLMNASELNYNLSHFSAANKILSITLLSVCGL